MSCCRLTKYARRELTFLTVLFVAWLAIVGLSGWPAWWIRLAGAVASVVVMAWVYWFFRDPQRSSPAGSGLFVSPADGRVTDLTPVGPESALGRDGLRVGVFMSIFDVHVNRSPCDAEIVSVTHRKGAFLDARHPDAATRNESAVIVMNHRRDGRQYPIVVRQVAGLVARRIVTDADTGRKVSRGERIGMIKFGSRLELFVPDELVGEVRVRIGQKVRAAVTVLIAAPDTQPAESSLHPEEEKP